MQRPVEKAPSARGSRGESDRTSHADTGSAGEIVAQFEIRYTRFLDENGRAVRELPAFARDPDVMRPIYEHMVLTRALDRKAVALQRTGQLGTYPSSFGQEGTTVAIGAAMARDDVLLGTYRETGAMLFRGVRIAEILQYWGGDEAGSDYRGPGAPRADFPICVPIATHAPHAVGVAYAMKLRREPRVAVCALGDGATSKGDFYEALNGAGVWQLPLVFVIVNNQWAISVPRSAQSHAETLAQKAIAAGIPAEQVDGDDAVAVYQAMRNALSAARDGAGPHVVEALTYRLSDHTTADDASRYRSADELERRRALDPIARLRSHLERAKLWSEADERRLEEATAARIEQAAAEFLALPPPPPEAMFDHLFAQLPEALREQRDALVAAAAAHRAETVSGEEDGQ
ncbi:MAG: pyruvate dehydrogenase (acetyl-transferring) E1 component subunit alpha [Gammaproteobacteria bacterium]|nr:pyruvate dehydrogenase (acetyl-transferring) E1 component subunit alpha [Gammaproteobacteria bacterium]